MKLESREERRRRVARQRRYGMITGFVTTVVVIFIAITLWQGKENLAKKNEAYLEQQKKLEEQIREQEERKATLEEFEKYMQTKQFAEEVGRDKFGLIYPDEIYFKKN